MKKNYILLLFYFVTTVTFSQVFITEIADPNNKSSVRYIELYNAGNAEVDLSQGWKLEKYLNGAAAITTHSVSLTGKIASKGFYILARGAQDTDFKDTFGFDPNQWEGSDDLTLQPTSNGDDVIQLVNGSTVVDIYGVVGVDGTGENWEFEDGRAARKSTVTNGNTTFNISEWSIDSDQPSGDGAQDTTGKFNPGVWSGTLSTKTFSKLKFELFPNPVQGSFVNINVDTSKDVDVELFNIVGKSVLKSKLTNNSLDISSIKKGIYLLRISSNDNFSTAKLIVN